MKRRIALFFLIWYRRVVYDNPVVGLISTLPIIVLFTAVMRSPPQTNDDVIILWVVSVCVVVLAYLIPAIFERTLPARVSLRLNARIERLDMIVTVIENIREHLLYAAGELGRCMVRQQSGSYTIHAIYGDIPMHSVVIDEALRYCKGPYQVSAYGVYVKLIYEHTP